jgi:hypothetical protein
VGPDDPQGPVKNGGQLPEGLYALESLLARPKLKRAFRCHLCLSDIPRRVRAFCLPLRVLLSDLRLAGYAPTRPKRRGGRPALGVPVSGRGSGSWANGGAAPALSGAGQPGLLSVFRPGHRHQGQALAGLSAQRLHSLTLLPPHPLFLEKARPFMGGSTLLLAGMALAQP